MPLLPPVMSTVLPVSFRSMMRSSPLLVPILHGAPFRATVSPPMSDLPPAAETSLPFGVRKTRPRSRWRRLAGWLPAFIALPVLVGAILHYGSLEKFIELARTARPEWMLPALAVQIATYFFSALSWHQVLARAAHPRPFRTLFRLSVAKLYTDQVLPTGGVSGSILVV